MKIVKDLGVTTLSGKYATPRRYVEAECPFCDSVVTVRKEHIKTMKSCKLCVSVIASQKAKEKAEEKLAEGKQTCTKCKQEKSLSYFHKDSSKESGYRSVCKTCRFSLEKESNKLYRQSEEGKIANSNKKGRRMSRIKSTCDNTVTPESLKQLKEEQDSKCAYCSSDLNFAVARSVHLDHVIPLALGGPHSMHNVVWSCAKCNLKKGAKTIVVAT